MAIYTCFTRKMYKYVTDFYGRKKVVPNPRARRMKYREFNSQEEAYEFCKTWNNSHAPGPLSRKMEYTSNY